MAAITSAGTGSGLDIEGLITKLMQAESQPLVQNQLKQTGLEAEISAYGKLSSAVSTFRSSVGALNRPTDFKVFTATSSDEKVLTATTSISATPGIYSAEVVRLAENHKKVAATGYADSSVTKVGVNNDFITITVGSSSFKVEFGGKTLDQVAQAVNSATDNKGVTATVIKGDGATPYKLALTANNSGSDGFLQLAYSVDHYEFGSTPAAVLSGSAYYADSGTTKIGRAGDTITLSRVGGAGPSTVAIGDMTLTQAAAAINGAGDNPGVTASVEQDTVKGYYLKLTAGSNITTSYATTANLSNLFSFADINVDRATTTGGVGDGSFDSADLNSIVKVDGTTATRQSNSISDVATGITFDLKKAGTATVTVTRDTSAITTRVQALVDAYNKFAETADSLAEGDLENNTALRSVQTQVRNLLNTKAVGLTYDYLAKVGVNFTLEDRKMADGTVLKVSRLELNKTTLSSAMNSNYADVSALFTDENSEVNNVTHVGQGFGYRLDNLLGNLVKQDGFLDTRVDGIGKQIQRLEKEEDTLGLRLELIEARYRTQFGALDILISNIRQTSEFLQQQMSSLPRIGR